MFELTLICQVQILTAALPAIPYAKLLYYIQSMEKTTNEPIFIHNTHMYGNYQYKIKILEYLVIAPCQANRD